MLLRNDCRTHLAPANDEFPFPKEVFERFVRDNDGGSERQGLARLPEEISAADVRKASPRHRIAGTCPLLCNVLSVVYEVCGFNPQVTFP